MSWLNDGAGESAGYVLVLNLKERNTFNGVKILMGKMLMTDSVIFLL